LFARDELLDELFDEVGESPVREANRPLDFNEEQRSICQL
jgi:hypothetical protein